MVWYFIVFALAVIGIAAMLLMEFPLRRRVKAGKANKYVFGYTFTRRHLQVSVGGDCLDPSGLKEMVAAGNSMKDYNIHDGDSVLVAPYDEQAKLSISHYPVIAIKLQGAQAPFDSCLKLRKFVGYVDDNDWGAAYEKYKSRVKSDITRDMFMKSCAKSYNKQNLSLSNDKLGVLSETYDVVNKCYHYSVHPVDSVYGKVMYVSGAK